MSGAPDPLFELSKLSCPCCYRPGVAFCENVDMAKVTPAHKIALLRILLCEEDVDAYICLSQDNHSSEYVSSCDERRSYLTNFSGSAGGALVTRSEAMLFTDSRYYLQAGNQLSSDWRLMKQEPSDPLIEDVIFDKLKGKKVGIDPYQFPNSKFKSWTEKWTKESAKLKRKDPSPSNNPPSLVPLPRNLVDAMWPTRPPIPQNPVKLHPDSLAGESVPSKLGRVRKAVSEESKADAIIISALDQIGWLFNLRGSDIMCNPVFFSYALVTSEGAAHLFLGRRDGNVDAVLDDEARAELGESGVEIHAYSDFNAEFLPSLLPEKAYVLVEKGTCSVAIAECVERGGGSVVETEWCSPVELFKAKKNSAEIAGIRDSARR